MVPELTFCSTLAEREIKASNVPWSGRALQYARQVTQLELQEGVESLAELFIAAGALRAVGIDSGRHIACAVLRDIDVLMTWNCRDIANARQLAWLRNVINGQQLSAIELVTPFELMEINDEDLWQGNPAGHRNSRTGR